MATRGGEDAADAFGCEGGEVFQAGLLSLEAVAMITDVVDVLVIFPWLESRILLHLQSPGAVTDLSLHTMTRENDTRGVV